MRICTEEDFDLFREGFVLGLVNLYDFERAAEAYVAKKQLPFTLWPPMRMTIDEERKRQQHKASEPLLA